MKVQINKTEEIDLEEIEDKVALEVIKSLVTRISNLEREMRTVIARHQLEDEKIRRENERLVRRF